MKTTLSHLYTQLDGKNNDESTLKITVDYDTKERRWTQLIAIQAYNHKEKIWTDLTHIFFNCFHDQAEAIIDKIDWADIYAREERTYNVEPVFEKCLQPFLILKTI